MTTEIRCKVELREDDTRQSPGRLTGVLLTYGERASDRPELFERGAFDLDAIKASGGIVINRQHTRGAPSPALTGVPASVLKYMAWAVYANAVVWGVTTRFRSLRAGAVRSSIADTRARSPRTDGEPTEKSWRTSTIPCTTG